MKKILLIDAFNFIHRAYHAIPKTFTNAAGEPTNALYGVTSMVINILEQSKPDYIAAAVDTPKQTFRAEGFTGYKAHRKPTEDDLSSQIPKVMEMFEAFGIKTYKVDGYEADDVMATIATRVTKSEKGDVDVIIASNDRDLWQMTSPNVMILLPDLKGNFTWLGPAESETRMGFPPSKIADYKGLKGDASDNIPGVFGVGDKTAVKLITEYGSLEEIYKHVAEIKPDGLREKLLNCYETAVMSKNLAKLELDVPFEFELEDTEFKGLARPSVKELLAKYNFKSLARRLGFDLPAVSGASGGAKKAEVSADQLGLF